MLNKRNVRSLGALILALGLMSLHIGCSSSEEISDDSETDVLSDASTDDTAIADTDSIETPAAEGDVAATSDESVLADNSAPADAPAPDANAWSLDSATPPAPAVEEKPAPRKHHKKPHLAAAATLDQNPSQDTLNTPPVEAAPAPADQAAAAPSEFDAQAAKTQNLAQYDARAEAQGDSLTDANAGSADANADSNNSSSLPSWLRPPTSYMIAGGLVGLLVLSWLIGRIRTYVAYRRLK